MTAEAGDAIDVALRVAHAIESVGGEYFIGGSDSYLTSWGTRLSLSSLLTRARADAATDR